jgi:hypothetical protein
VSYESNAVGLDRNELGMFLVQAGLSGGRDHALACLLALNGLRISEALNTDIEHLGMERGHRTLTITRRGGSIVTKPLAPRTARAIDLCVGERDEGPILLNRDGDRRLDRHAATRIVRRLAVDDWYRHVIAAGDLTSGLLIAQNNDTVAELNEQARTRLAASRRLNGPALETTERVFQAGDRILCRQNRTALGVLNGDLGTVDSVNTGSGSLTVRLDRDPDTRDLPSWYLEDGHVDHGFALTGHKAQGVTTGRTFTLIDGGTDREWVYVALSRGQQGNTLYLANLEPGDEPCTCVN